MILECIYRSRLHLAQEPGRLQRILNEGEQLIEDVILRFKRLRGNLDVPDEKAVTLLWKLFQKEPIDFYVRHVESDA
eukprot:CAMPEP_0184714956 /NCGR_PEP_ID=MMETSP0314-20130426/4978_1 /TAXON_ID=38298 /ORGANISM="Rhodella maculata, Strain CCMP 736" /LENGTH=76 /DNA_ID=CAMNT_0027177983 /DNA_START=46 /DNA_END=274 /DNA_ORIENTATION=+